MKISDYKRLFGNQKKTTKHIISVLFSFLPAAAAAVDVSTNRKLQLYYKLFRCLKCCCSFFPVGRSQLHDCSMNRAVCWARLGLVPRESVAAEGAVLARTGRDASVVGGGEGAGFNLKIVHNYT